MTPDKRARPRNPLALVVLAQLLERPMHPYEIAAQMRQRGHHEVIRLNYGALYGVVESLEEAGLVAAGETTREGRRPERTVYALTPAGRAMLSEWLRDVLRRPAVEYPIFAAGLALMGALPPGEVLLLLDERAQALERSVGEQEASLDVWRGSVPRLFLVESEYAVHMRRAELEWVRRLVREIRSGKLDGVDAWKGLHAPGGLLATTLDPPGSTGSTGPPESGGGAAQPPARGRGAGKGAAKRRR
jgi:DNA-binding PadR family transcriptional regulator